MNGSFIFVMKNNFKIYSYIKENKMLAAGDTVCVGLSGGADSVCLLQLLYELKERLDISVTAFHVNHRMRGEESDADERYVLELCRQRGIEVKTFSFDVVSVASEMKKGTEETGRILRRRAAAECIETGFATKIALAHHINDRAETFMFNLARGSSLKGLKGISAVNGYFIRPLLCMTRDEIENELRIRDIRWCTDSTNLTDDYSRNKIRLNILPYFEKNINSRSIEHISLAARDIEEANEIIEELAASKEESLTKTGHDEILILPDILKEKKLIAGCIIMRALKKLTGTVVDLTREHVSDIFRLIELQSGKEISLPYEILAYRSYDGVVLCKKASKNSKDRTEDIILNTEGRTAFNGLCFECSILDAENIKDEIPKKRYTKWFDYDKISGGITLRFRKNGDYFISDGQLHKKKLKDYFIDNKIPREKRDDIVCAADGSKILWIIGCRISEDIKITENTKKILEIRVTGEDIYE